MNPGSINKQAPPIQPKLTSMPAYNDSRWSHDHTFNAGNPAAERGTRAVMWITSTMMVV
jgi:hypothetical protein